MKDIVKATGKETSKETCKDLVSITCYGSTTIEERSKAIEEFREAVEFCEGSEQERYAYILCKLMTGAKVINDRDA